MYIKEEDLDCPEDGSVFHVEKIHIKKCWMHINVEWILNVLNAMVVVMVITVECFIRSIAFRNTSVMTAYVVKNVAKL
jgi:hypothetical protein